ncbi:hypothetical protein O4328_44265 [Rhodococcus opacus]|uniref:DUF3263 domain-containing protein n=1 Tax=Rhodococcus opacus TaxID=37919 RepID=A0AAX3YS62_RHOOP|nr:hypothetical protein [Rhodococcus opacus]MCZ4590550.1 hypothetical protein [Rhodococcus opacus]WLF52247.1 hypothetical protein Q5707_43385 [Rhodococcus opacus]
MNSREYRQYRQYRQHRQWRQRRRAGWIGSDRERNHPDREAEHLIEFAITWAPFGGAAEEEILVRFGMTTRRFIERLWEVIPESNCAEDEISTLASAYPRGIAKTGGRSL